MPAPTIPTMPAAPVRGEDATAFATKANDMVDALAPMVTAMNSLGGWMESTAADAEASRVAAEAAEAAGAGYETADVELGGDFNASMFVRCTRVGNMVTITGLTALTHPSNSAPNSTLTAIPAAYRPSLTAYRLSHVSSGYLVSVTIGSTGLFYVSYAGITDGEAASRSGTGTPPSITYCI